MMGAALVGACGPVVDPQDETSSDSGGSTETETTGAPEDDGQDTGSSASASTTGATTTPSTAGSESGSEDSSGGDPIVEPTLPVTIDSARLDVECIDSCGSIYGSERLRLSVTAPEALGNVTIDWVGWAFAGDGFPAEAPSPLDTITLPLEANTSTSVRLEDPFEGSCHNREWDETVRVQLRIDGTLVSVDAESYYGGPGSNEC